MSDVKFRVYECPVCHQWYNSHPHLKWHYDTDHPEYEALDTITRRYSEAQPRFAFQCTECGQLFHGADELKRHMYDKHSTTAHDVYGGHVFIETDKPSYEIPTNPVVRHRTTEEKIEFVLREIVELKQRIAALEEENERLKAGK